MTTKSTQITALTLSAAIATTAMVTLTPVTALAIVAGGYADLFMLKSLAKPRPNRPVA
jgi:hypothetical protein